MITLDLLIEGRYTETTLTSQARENMSVIG